MHKMPPPRPSKPRNGGRNSQRPTNQRVKRKSKSNLEKAGGYAYGAAKSITGVAKGITKAEIAGLKAVGGFLMPQRPAAKMMLKRMQKMPNLSPNMPSNRLQKPAKRKPFGGTETRPNEREGKRVAPRQRMPKELEKNPPRRKRPRPSTYQPLPNPRRPYKPKSPRDLSNRRRRNASGGGSGSSYGS